MAWFGFASSPSTADIVNRAFHCSSIFSWYLIVLQSTTESCTIYFIWICASIVSYQIPEKNTMTYFPETNVLVSVNNVVKDSNMPASKYVKIQIKKHDPAVYKKVDEMLIQGEIDS